MHEYTLYWDIAERAIMYPFPRINIAEFQVTSQYVYSYALGRVSVIHITVYTKLQCFTDLCSQTC